MTDPFFSARGTLAAAPRLIKRTALFSGGVIAGAVVSALSGYALVSLLYPAAPAPSRVVAEAPAAVAQPGAGARYAEARLAVARPAEPVVPGRAAPAVVVPEPKRHAPRPADDLLAEATPRLPAYRAHSAGLAGAASEGLTPALTSATLAAPGITTQRPRPRPQAPAPAVARSTVPDAEAEIPAIRPAPRPERLRLAAATAPSTDRRAAGSGSDACGGTLARAIPARRGDAPGAGAFFAGLGGLSGSERDDRVIAELGRGNIPGFLRVLEPVSFSGTDANGARAEITICVTSDYLALGSDRDYVRVPLGLPAAARIAGQFDMMLPTPLMVDAIYAQADVQLSPAPMTPGPQMSSTPYLLKHNATIEGQLRGRGGLIAGQKKDVVMTSRMASNPGRVAIYGWHRSSGSPIQPVSTVHGAHYADYSHGIRLVSKTAYLNGRAVALDELLASGRYAALLNTEGPLPGGVIRIASR